MPTKKELAALRKQAAGEARLDRDVLDRLANLTEEHKLYVFRPETRCKVCLSDANSVVNKMLAHAMTYTDIIRALEPFNATLPDSRRITYHSLWHHAKKHFPIEETAKATYRRMVEKRAEEYDVDFVAGVAGALTPMAYLDVVMNKGFQNLVDETTVVDVETGLRAAEKLHEITKAAQDESDMGDLMLRVQRIVDAVRKHVPEDMYERILADIEGDDQPAIPEALDAEVVEEDDPILDEDDPDLVLDDERDDRG